MNNRMKKTTTTASKRTLRSKHHARNEEIANGAFNYLPEDFHLGKLLKAELKKQGRSAVWLAKQVNCTPENIYKAFRSQWITMTLLFRISMALEHDFFHDCSIQLRSIKK